MARPPATAPVVGASYTGQAAECRSGEYSVAPLTAHVIHIVVSGFWSASTMADFVGDAGIAIGSLACAPADCLVLCDISQAAIQSQPIFAQFLALLTDGAARPRRVALISNSPISRMQARRLMAYRDHIALFEDESVALRWLTDAA